MAEPIFFSPQRDVSLDASLRRERETNQTLQAALDRAYEQLRNVDVSSNLMDLKRENAALESELSREKSAKAKLVEEVRQQGSQLQEYQKVFEFTLDQIKKLVREDAWKLPDHEHPPVSMGDIRFDPEGIQPLISKHIEELVQVRKKLEVTQRDEISQRSAADMKTARSEIVGAQARLADQQRLITELTKTVDAQKERIEAQKQSITALTETLATREQQVESTLTMEPVFPMDEAMAFEDAQDDSRMLVSPAFGRGMVEMEEKTVEVVTEMEVAEAEAPQSIPSSSLQSDSPPAPTLPASQQSQSQSPTPRLDSLFSTTRRPRIRLRSDLQKDSETTTVAIERTRKATTKKPKTPVTPVTGAGDKEDAPTAPSTFTSTRAVRIKRVKATESASQ